MPMVIFRVEISKPAEQDLVELAQYIAQENGRERAVAFLRKMLSVIDSLAKFPERGSYPQELTALGYREFRQLITGTYRLIYQISEAHVVIHVIADGRRNMSTLLARHCLDW